MTEAKQRSEEWFKQRKGRVTGSAVGAILNLSPWAKRNDIMRNMVRQAHGIDTFTSNVATEYGTTMEPQAQAAYEIVTGNKVEEAYFVTYADWLGASPDGYVMETGLLEIKCPYGLRNDVQPEFKSIDDQPYYYAQMQIQMYCTKREWCHFYQWNPYGSKLEVVVKDEDWLSGALPILKAFHDEYLQQCEPPFCDMWLSTDDDFDAPQVVLNYLQAKKQLEDAKHLLDEAKQQLIDVTKGKGGKVNGLSVSKVKKQGAISYSKAIKDLLPNVDLEPYRGKDSEFWSVR